MAEPDARTEALLELREHIKKDLGYLHRKFERLFKHLKHMDAGDLDRLQPLLEAILSARTESGTTVRHELKVIHMDVEQCRRDQETEAARWEEPEPEPTWWNRVREKFAG